MLKEVKNTHKNNVKLTICKSKLKVFLKKYKLDIILIAILFILTCVFFWKIIVNPDQLVYFGDTYRQFYPWHYFATKNYTPDQVPLWLPYSFSGEPFIANMQTGFFYPLNILIYSVFQTNLACGLDFLLHVFLAGLFMYIFVRYIHLDRISSFLSSIIFMFSGFLIAHTYAGHNTIIAAVSWIPLIFLLFEMALNKKSIFYGILAGVPIGLQFLSGHLQTSFITLIALGLYFLFRVILAFRKNRDRKKISKIVVISITAITIGFSLAAIQLLPSIELTQQVTREGGANYEFAVSYSFPAYNVIALLLPNFFGNPVKASYWNASNWWELTPYMGVLTLILIFFAIYFKRKDKYVLFFTGLTIISFLLALGEQTPIYWLLWKYVPGFNMFRAPSRFLILATFSASILAGYGFSILKRRLSEQEKIKIWKFVKIISIPILMLICTIFITFIFSNQIIQFFQQIMKFRYLTSGYTIPSGVTLDYLLKKVPSIIYNDIMEDLIVLLILSTISVGILVFLIKKKESIGFRTFAIKPRTVFQIAVVVVILCDLCFFGVGLIDTKDLGETYTRSDYVEFLIENTDGYRVYDEDKIILNNFQIIYGIQDISGYNPLELNDYSEVFNCIHNLSDNQNHPILNLLNVKYIITSTQLNNSGFKLVFDNNHTHIYENMNVLPRAFVIYNVSVKSENEIISELKNESFNPVDTLLISKDVDNLPSSNKTYEPVEILKYSPNEIILQTNTTESSFLVLSEVYYPDWKAYVDGEQKEVYRAYNALRAIKLDEGSHTIKFTCYSSSLNTGTTITIITIVFLILIILIKFLLVLIKIKCPWRKKDDYKKL